MGDVDFRAWLDGVVPQGRFGAGDRIGTANLIDPAARLRAAGAIQTGATVHLGRPVAQHPSARGDGRPGFALEVYYTDGPIGMGSDHVELDCHGVYNTHLDALNHLSLDRTWYGGWPVDSDDGPSVDHLARHGLFTRGVLADIPALRGTPWVSPDEPVTGDDIDRALATGGVTFEPGDALLLYMGRDRWEGDGNIYRGAGAGIAYPGVGRSGAEWIADHGVSVLCWDFLDSTLPAEQPAPVHLLIWAMGLVVVDNCDLAPAAHMLADARRQAGGLVVAPLRIQGATGCTVNPMLVL
jgi:kynurenine formamidase